MSVHWSPSGQKTKNKTIRHDKAFCHCPDGTSCRSGEYVIAPKKEVVNKTLEMRLKSFDTMKPQTGTKGNHFRHRPGSTNRKKS